MPGDQGQARSFGGIQEGEFHFQSLSTILPLICLDEGKTDASSVTQQSGQRSSRLCVNHMSSVSTFPPKLYNEVKEAEGTIDYSIHFLEPLNLLIAHMRYIGDDYEGDMAEIGKSEHTKKWWKVSRSSRSSLLHRASTPQSI